MLERLPEPSVARRHACQPPSWTAREMPSPLSDAGCTLRPTHRQSVSRCSVTPLSSPSTAQYVKAPPAGLEPAASGLRARRHFPFDHGGVKPRRQGSNLRLAINSRASYRFDHTGVSGTRGSRTPKAARPTRFRDGIPRQWQSFREVTPAGLEPATRRLRVGSSGLLSYGAVSVAGRSRTCIAPRFKRALYRLELRPRVWARLESNPPTARCTVRQGLIPLSYSPVIGGAGVEPASSSVSGRRSAIRATRRRGSGTRTRTSTAGFRAQHPAV